MNRFKILFFGITIFVQFVTIGETTRGIDSGWELINPDPIHSYSLSKIWSDATLWPAAFIISEQGVIYYFNGTELTTLVNDPSYTLYDIWGSDPNNIFVVGENEILNWNGSAWRDMQQEANVPLSGNCIWGASANEVYVGQGENLLCWDGNTWEIMSTMFNWDITDIWGTSSEDIYVIGFWTDVLHWNGSEWTEMGPNGSAFDWIWKINGSGADDIYVYNRGYNMHIPYHLIQHFDGTQWSTIYRLPSVVNDIQVRDSEVWFVGSDGMCCRWCESEMEEFHGPSLRNLNGVSLGMENELLLVGDYNTIIHYNGSVFTMMNQYCAADLYGIWCANHREAFAVGEQGTFLKGNGSSWTALQSGTTQSLLNVWGSSSRDVWAVGNAGTIIHWNGSSCNSFPPLTTKTLFDIWGTSSDTILAVGRTGTILYYNGLAWSQIVTPFTYDLFKIWGSSLNDIYTGGTNGMILHWNGSSWSETPVGDGFPIIGLWGSGPNDVYVCNNNHLLHWDGVSWNPVDVLGSNQSFMNITGTAPDNVFIRTILRVIPQFISDQMYRFNGTDWQSVGLCLDNIPSGIYAENHNTLFTVTNDGLIFRYHDYPIATDLKLASTLVHPGDLFWVQGRFDSFTSADIGASTVFCVLEVFGSYYFWPSWNYYSPPDVSYDYAVRDFPSGLTEINFLVPFVWPYTGDETVSGLIFYTAVLDLEITSLVSNLSAIPFGFGP